MAEKAAAEDDFAGTVLAGRPNATARGESISFPQLWVQFHRNRALFLSIFGTLLGACLLYCLLAPKVFEATARLALRSAPESTLAIDRTSTATAGSFAPGQVQLETEADVFRSERLAWEVIRRLRLYDNPGFSRVFPKRFSEFDPLRPDPVAREYLLEAFQGDLTVESVPHTLVLEIRFRSQDAGLSAAVVNALIEAERDEDAAARLRATRTATDWLNEQLKGLKADIDRDDQKLTAFQRQHGILDAPEKLEDGRLTDVEHAAELDEVDALGRELANARTDRILREAEYRAAQSGDPELVLASDPRNPLDRNQGSALLSQLRGKRSDLELEEAQLRIERGPNFPRVLEIHNQLQSLDQQIRAEDTKLVVRFRNSWKVAVDREQLLRANLKEVTGEGLKLNEATLKYSAMRQEEVASRNVYLQLLQQVTQAGVSAGIRGSAISVIDYARPPAKPVSPNLPLNMAIALFVSFWIAAGVVSARERLCRKHAGIAVSLIAVALLASPGGVRAQAPTPSTSGLPTGVARIPQSAESKSVPNGKSAPTVWSANDVNAGVPPGAGPLGQQMAAPIAPGDMLEVTEAHTPEMRSAVRVSESGTVNLPLAGEVSVNAMDERTAAHAIESALIERGMLLHPQVTVLVTAYAGQDVSVLGEVARPGVYSYTVHHRLLDLISAASGLTPNAGRLVTITHRKDPGVTLPLVLDLTGADAGVDHNPELEPGDTIQVSRAGLVYVVGDVVRPGAFPVDPAQTTTVVQALSLAWGPGQNAALTKAVLIREQQGGRTITTLNVKRLLRGQDPDMPIRDRDILFVPDSMAKNLWNRTMESVIQSAAGVSIYAGLVYSQRF